MMLLVVGMADFQYQPDMSDPVAELRKAMASMDGEQFWLYKCTDRRSYSAQWTVF